MSAASYEKFAKEVLAKQKKQAEAKEKAKKTPITSDDGYLVDYSKLKRKPMPKYKAKGGLKREKNNENKKNGWRNDENKIRKRWKNFNNSTEKIT